jgi:hypothetical protein
MTVLSSIWEGHEVEKLPVEVAWTVEGLRNIDCLPNWYVLFYGAVTNALSKLFKPALLDYATAFEAFLEEFLLKALTAQYDSDRVDILMRRFWRVEERCKDLLYIATGHRLTERPDIYDPWVKYVQKRPRNLLMHGENLPVDSDAIENAHQAVYQAIRWIEEIGTTG